MNRAEVVEHLRTWKPGPRGQAPPRPISSTAWRCEGEWQAADQMDIWECADEVELDERRARGELDEDDDE